MRVACLLIGHLPALVELLRRPHLQRRPFVVVEPRGRRSVVIDALSPHMAPLLGATVEEALSYRPDTLVIKADRPAYRHTFREVLTALQGVSDRVEPAEPGTAYVALDGLHQMYGGEARLATALLRAAPERLRPRVGLAGGKFPALAAARRAAPLSAFKAPKDVANFLRQEPIHLLPIADDVKDAMRRLGINVLGDLTRWPADQLMDRFGAGGRLAHRLAQGIDDRPLVPMKPQEDVTETVALPFATASVEMLLTAIDRALKRAFARPEVRGRFAGRVELVCRLFRAPPWQRTVHFKRGRGQWDQASQLIRRQLTADLPPAPVEELTLTLAGLSGGSAVQLGLLPDVKKDRHQRLVEVDRQLRVRSGVHALHRTMAVSPGHPAPEMRALLSPIDPLAEEAMRPMALPIETQVREGPGGEPAAVLIGNRWRAVTGVEERWSFDLWWAPEPISRAYYRVSRDDGAQMTLFRDLRGGGWRRHP